MKEKLQQLIHDFEKKSQKTQELLELGSKMSADDIQQATQLNEELLNIKEQITALRKMKETFRSNNAFLNNPISQTYFGNGASLDGMHPSGQAIVGEKGILHQEGEGLVDEKTLRAISDPNYKAAFRNYLRKGEWGLSRDEVKTLQLGLDTEGGFLVPQDMLARIVQKEPTPTRIAAYVRHLGTSRDTLVIPKVDYEADNIYSNGMRVKWTGEDFASSNYHQVEQPQFGQIAIPIHTAMMSLQITNDMVEDSLFPIQSWCADKFRETIDVLTDEMILKGSGIGQPTGILTQAGKEQGPKTMKMFDGDKLSIKKIQELAFSIPEQYTPNAKWIFNMQSTALALANLQDENHRPLWGAGLHDAGLETGYLDKKLVGFPVIYSGLMPDNADGNPSMIFGDPSGYYLVNRIGFSIQVLREVEALRNRLVLVGRLRFGGAVAEPWKLKVGTAEA